MESMDDDNQIQSGAQPQSNKDPMGQTSTDTSMVSHYQPQSKPGALGSGVDGDAGDDEKKNLWRSLL